MVLFNYDIICQWKSLFLSGFAYLSVITYYKYLLNNSIVLNISGEIV